MATDPKYAPVYDLAGAAYTKLGRRDAARKAFETSLLASAAGFFAEAIWLEPESTTARQGLVQAQGH